MRRVCFCRRNLAGRILSSGGRRQLQTSNTGFDPANRYSTGELSPVLVFFACFIHVEAGLVPLVPVPGLGTPRRNVMTLSRDDARRSMRLIVEDRRQPTLALVDRPLFPLRIVFDLIAFDFSHTEICALRMAEVEAADRCSGPHCEALRQSYADTLAVEQPEQHALLGVVGLRRIAGRGTDSAILLRDQLLI